ncbi:MAG TPA: hypothetical protein H9881_16330 [Candidatus Stackebrandtia excrementipullorum]|nr:hypothetical protein [Candidatus Stackebrandtia excrementipullorum]
MVADRGYGDRGYGLAPVATADARRRLGGLHPPVGRVVGRLRLTVLGFGTL